MKRVTEEKALRTLERKNIEGFWASYIISHGKHVSLRFKFQLTFRGPFRYLHQSFKLGKAERNLKMMASKCIAGAKLVAVEELEG